MHDEQAPQGTEGSGRRAGRAADEALFLASVSATRLPMVVTDPSLPDNGIVLANEAFLDLIGYRAGEVLGRNCRFLQGPETDRAVVARLREAILERRAVAAELLNYRRDGSSFWNALFVSPLFGRDGRLRYFFASQRDVLRHHDAEAALRQAQKMEALGQFTGSIAHDFNNLLQVITGYLDTLRTRLEVRAEPEVAAALSTIGAAAERGATLTRQLLGFARKQRLEGRVVNLNTLVESIWPMAAKMLGREVRLETRLARDLSNARLDPVQSEMAIRNLLTNARDAMPNGGRIVIRTENRKCAAGRPRRHRPTCLPASMPCSRSQTPGLACRARCLPARSTRSSPRRRQGAAPGSGSPWPTASCASRTAGSRSPPRRAREPQ